MTENVTFYCPEHLDKTKQGKWIENGIPCNCDYCESPAKWILIEKKVTDDKGIPRV